MANFIEKFKRHGILISIYLNKRQKSTKFSKKTQLSISFLVEKITKGITIRELLFTLTLKIDSSYLIFY